MIEFYIQTPVEDLNELRALIQIGRLLRRGVAGNASEMHYLVANIDPDSVKAWRGQDLPQLDGMLICPTGITLLEIKACPDRFDGRSTSGRWRILEGRSKGRYVKAGSKTNPYLQAKNARYAWMNLLAAHGDHVCDPERTTDIVWSHLSSCVLFSPKLHPQSAESIPHYGKDSSWLTITGIDKVDGYMMGIRSALELSYAERRRLLTDVLQAKPWIELDVVIDQKLGELHIQTQATSQTLIREIMRHDELLVGRSRDSDLQIPDLDEFRYVGRRHIRIESGADYVCLHNEAPRNGTFINGRRLDPNEMVELQANDRIELGISGKGGCQLVYRKSMGGGRVNTTQDTKLA